MRQVGILASAGLYAIENHFPKLSETHNNAKLFAKKMIESGLFEIDLSRVETNIVLFKHSEKINSEKFRLECEKQGVRFLQFGERVFRAVFHFQISKKQAVQAAEVIINVANNFLK